MRLTDYLIIFVIILIPFIVVSDLKTKELQCVEYKKLSMDKMLEAAVDDAVSEMVEKSEDNKVSIDREKAVNCFFNSLFLNMRIIDNEVKQKEVAGYIPVIAITDYTGYYILSNEIFTAADGSKRIEMKWHPKKMYAAARDNYVISFTLDLNYVSIYDSTSRVLTEGAYEDIKSYFTETYIQDKDEFMQMRRDAIINSLQADVNQCINRHNEIAKHFGIAYNFTLPNIEENAWTRTISDYGLIAFFQGMPVGLGQYYNTYALGGARVVKKIGLYIKDDPATGFKYYHRPSCRVTSPTGITADDAKEAALEGALPCPECKP